MKRAVLLILILVTAAVIQAGGQVRWSMEYNLGLPVNIPAPLILKQDGRQAVKMVAVWSARSFNLPLNWMWRIERWNEGRSWSFETVHHKMVLNNQTDYVQWLSITHGFNTLTIGRGWELRKLILRAGTGMVLAHPESRIDGHDFDENAGWFDTGYYLTGPVFMTSLARPLRIGRSFLINLEGKITSGFATIPITDGKAKLIHLAFHLNFGLGFSVRGRSPETGTRQYAEPRNEL